ncbi:MAG: flagellar basal-body MS-ring/collar protein FliF, partial [Candidatus Margulisbacteria bacterium]|nr:flagellar basal-body MS-ring/collar protein FliF [Candidatus Margulisiibacteriota bacterium]
MAEAATGFDPRRLLLVGAVVAVVVFSVLFFLFRGCAPMAGPKKAGMTVVYSNLELKDAANVIARLKELAIPYEIRDEGRAVAVPKEKADQARLGLAEKKLPAGGQVGWEIFDESRLGATDFDRRIQLIRAISGELARNIQRIEGIEDARVQVVIPETQLFAAQTAPVTAAVLIRLRSGYELAPEKIKGIVYLVASSVENLQPENVTVVDDSGRILTTKAGQPPLKYAPAPTPSEAPVVMATPETVAVSPEVIIKKEEPAKKAAASLEAIVKAPTAKTPTAEAGKITLTGLPSLTAEEKVLLKVQTKKELESDLSGKAQELLNRFYPLNSIIVKVTADIKPAKDKEIKAKELKVKKLTAIVLVDNRVDFNANLKQATYTTVAAAIAYNKKRGDRIIVQRVPFHLANPPLQIGKVKPQKTAASAGLKKLLSLVSVIRLIWWGIAVLAVLILIFWLNSLRRR